LRISTSYEFGLYANDVDAAQQKLVTAQQQVITGQSFTSASDNPGGTIQLLNMNEVQNQLNQYQSNLTTAKTTMDSTSAALGTASTVMQSAYQVALQATSGTNNSTTMQDYVTQIDQLQQQLVSAGNTQAADGSYLFAGQKTSQEPFSASNGQITYSGDGNSINVPVGPSATMAVNVPGSPLFTDAYQQLEALKTDLQSGNTSAVSSTDIGNVQTSMQSFTSASADLGAQTDQVESLTTDNQRRIEDLTTQISGLQDVNTAQATTNYTQAQTAYQAALQVVSQASSLSLSSFLSSSNA
jgi:flagellar hook-associated protein 3 FlgL